MYTLAVSGRGSAVAGSSNTVAYIDGTPSNTSLLGGMNEYIWDSNRNNFTLCDMGVIQSLRDIQVGEPAYMGYGDNYNWDEYKLVLVKELGCRLIEGVTLFGHPSFQTSVTQAVDQLGVWEVPDLPHKRLGSSFEKLVMAVIDGRVDISLHHSVAPSWLCVEGVLEQVGTWIERFLTCSNVLALSSFRQAHNPALPTRSPGYRGRESEIHTGGRS